MIYNSSPSLAFHTQAFDILRSQICGELKNIEQAEGFLKSKLMSEGELAVYIIAKLNNFIGTVREVKNHIQLCSENEPFYNNKIIYMAEILQSIKSQTQGQFASWLHEAFQQIYNLRSIIDNTKSLIENDNQDHLIIKYCNRFDSFLFAALDFIAAVTTSNDKSAFTLTF